uniref:Uncharacterized protein n=1 Tax=Anguilla anguilla TaxID=7936 RepID=A0A0E9TUS4_ANGAN
MVKIYGQNDNSFLLSPCHLSLKTGCTGEKVLNCGFCLSEY